jgi:murein DD-endopeptidase MepM/ murein hydrolase activator NlpD
MAYGWPVKPFDQQHRVRGFFGDPRIGSDGGTSFHFGVDVSVPDGTPVYSVISGTVHLDVAGGPQNIAVTSPGVTHGYWHVQPTVAHGQHVNQHDLLGHVAATQGHVHLAERTPGGPYLNPLRAGALTPFTKQHPPIVDRTLAERNGHPLDVNALTGVVALFAEAHDVTPIPPLAPYTHMPVTPALLRWRLVAHATEVVPWRTSADFRSTLPANSLYDTIYAAGTTQNHPPIPGCYRFQRAAAFDTTAHRDGSYRLDVEVADTRGNASRGHRTVTLTNAV